MHLITKMLSFCSKGGIILPYKIVFYKTQSGKVPVREYLKDIRKLYGDNELNTIRLFLDLLEKHGMTINNYRSHAIRRINNELYELRPGGNRIFFFYFKDEEFVLLHAYRKQKMEAPKFEIDTAIKRLKDYKRRF